MVKRSIAAMLIFISFSCNRADVQDILSKQQVEDILLEIFLIDTKAKVIIFNEPADKVRMQLNYDMKNLFEQYNTNYEQFMGSYSHYMKDASISKNMMSNITNRLIVLEAKHTGNIKLIDSLRVK